MFGLSKLFHRPPSREQFASDVLIQLKARRPDLNFEYDQPQFRIRASDGGVVFLDNSYLDYSKAPRSERAVVIQGFLAGLDAPEVPSDFAAARPHLLPVLRHIVSLESLRIEAPSGKADSDVKADFPVHPFSTELGVGIAFDSEHSISQISDSHLVTWKRSFDDVLEVALSNLQDRSPPRFEAFEPGFYVSQYGDYYDATRLLLPHLAWQLPLRGAPVAMVPNRAALLLTGDADVEGIAAMVAQAKKVLLEDSRPLGPEMFRLEGDQWRVWQPPGASGDRLYNLQLHLRAADYDIQKQALQRQMERSGEDVFVATFSIAQRNGVKRFHSFSVLTRGVDTLLPRTDRVALALLETKETIMITWPDFERIASHLLTEPLPLTLPRFRIRGFPSDAELVHLRQLQTAE